MVTTASKLYYAAATVALVASWVYGWGTGGGLSGPLLFGFKGGVGELAGYVVLQSAAGVLLVLGITASILRDADPDAQARAARLEALPPAVPASGPSYWPVLGALGAIVAAVGLVASPVLFVIGLLGLALVVIEWMVSAWSERATGDPAVNRRIRNRLMYPIEIPVAGALIILVVVASLSRVLLAVDRNASSAAAIVVAAAVLALAFVFAYRPKISKDAIAVVLAIAAVAVVTGGIVGATAGSREFEPHAEEHGELAPEGEESQG